MRKVVLVFLTISLLGTAVATAAWRTLQPGLSFLSALKAEEPADPGFTVAEHPFNGPGDREIPCRVYRPAGRAPERAVLLLHGVHTLGYKEPRLARFARELARQGCLVVTPDLEDLRNYDLGVTAVDDIEASALEMLDGLKGAELPRRPLVMGISFAGGLGLTATGRERLRHRFGGYFAFGAHGDLDRVLGFLASGRLPDGGKLEPHLYGQAVVARKFADRLVPEWEVEPLRAALKLFLQEKPEDFRRAYEALPEGAKRIARPCLEWDAAAMSRLLAPLAKEVASDPRLSPERNPGPGCPLFLLHGASDNVIPPSETLALQRWALGRAAEVLVTDLISHVELKDEAKKESSLAQTWRLARMFSRLLKS